MINIFMSSLNQAVCAKTTGSHMVLRGNILGPVSATDPVKSSKDVASFVACTRKKNFAWGVRIFCE